MEDSQRNTTATRDIAADLISEPSTGTNLDIAATDEIRPIPTTRDSDPCAQLHLLSSIG